MPQKLETAPNVLSIAGFDPSGGAGILADIKTFAALGCYGLAAITASTVQNTRGVAAVSLVDIALCSAQIDALFADAEIAAVKLGLMGSGEIVRMVAEKLAHYRPAHVVLDPVLRASSGDALATDDVVAAMREELAPHATLVTPNLTEAARLASEGAPATSLSEMEQVAARLQRAGFRAVLVKGGHLPGAESTDIFYDGTGFQQFSGPRIATANTHGTGCTLSSAIAAGLAKGLALPAAIAAAKIYVTRAIQHSGALKAGQGAGPLHHFSDLW